MLLQFPAFFQSLFVSACAGPNWNIGCQMKDVNDLVHSACVPLYCNFLRLLKLCYGKAHHPNLSEMFEVILALPGSIA